MLSSKAICSSPSPLEEASKSLLWWGILSAVLITDSSHLFCWLFFPWVSAVMLKLIQVSESMVPSYPRALMFDFICVPLSRMFHEAPLFSSGTFSIRLTLTPLFYIAPACSIVLWKCLITQYPKVLKWTLNAVTEGYQYWTDHHKCPAKYDHQFSKARCVGYLFHNCDKTPDTNTVQKGSIYLGSWFQIFLPIVAGRT